MQPSIIWGIISTTIAVIGIPLSFYGGWMTSKHFSKNTEKKYEKTMNELKKDYRIKLNELNKNIITLKNDFEEMKGPLLQILQNATPGQIEKVENTFEYLSTGLMVINKDIISAAEHLSSIQTIGDIGKYRGPGSEKTAG